jgi:hypothetical protein
VKNAGISGGSVALAPMTAAKLKSVTMGLVRFHWGDQNHLTSLIPFDFRDRSSPIEQLHILKFRSDKARSAAAEWPNANKLESSNPLGENHGHERWSF